MAEGTRATGWAKFVKEKVNSSGLQALSTRATSWMTNVQVKALSPTPSPRTPVKEKTVLSIEEIGLKIRDTVMAHTRLPMVANMKAISRMTYLMDKENWPGQIDLLTKAIGWKACSLVRESSCSQMEASMTECGMTTRGQDLAKWRGSKATAASSIMRVIGQKIGRLASVLTRGLMARNTWVALQTIKWLAVWVPVFSMATVAFTWAISRTTSDMAKVSSHSAMAARTKESGWTIWSTVKVHTRGKTSQFWWEPGITVSMSKDNWRRLTRRIDEFMEALKASDVRLNLFS